VSRGAVRLAAIAGAGLAFVALPNGAQAQASWKTCGDGYRACLEFCQDSKSRGPDCADDCKARLEGSPQACMISGTFKWAQDKPAVGPLDKVR
jgi:hypothetical protein